MTDFLDRARDSVEELRDLLEGVDDDQKIDEDRIDKLTGGIAADVKHHNDELAEREMMESDR